MISLIFTLLKPLLIVALCGFVVACAHLLTGLSRASRIERYRAQAACGNGLGKAIRGEASDRDDEFLDFRCQHAIAVRKNPKSKCEALVLQSTISDEGISQLLDR